MRLTTSLACAASILAATTALGAGGTATAAVQGAPASEPANVSDFLATQR